MDSTALITFETVARAGGITRAARELYTVQSNVTARIRSLEQELGVRLFDRHARGISLTGAGQRLLPYAREVARLLGEARRAVQDDGTPSGALTVGSLETTAAIRLPPILSQYAAVYPEVDLRLRTGTTGELIEQVLRHEVEGAFVAGPVVHPDLVAEPVVEEELVLVTASHIGTIEALAGVPNLKTVLFRAGCSYRERLERILIPMGLRTARLEFGSLEGILGCVGAGMGITLLPRSVVETLGRGGRLRIHSLPPEEAQVTTVFIRRRGAFVSSALRRFLEQVEEHRALTRTSPTEGWFSTISPL